MSASERPANRAVRLAVLGAVLLLVLSGVLWWMSALQRGTRVTAYFDATVGLYAGSEVRVLGMPVGSVQQITPQGPVVRVDVLVDDEVPVPADARAVSVTPSMVSDRYIQLTPAYESGPRLPDGAVIPRERTATPAELDELTKNVDQLTTALGPGGANKDGALSGLLDTGANNLRGNGEDLNRTMTQLGQVARTLSDSRGDLFATVDNLQKFTGMLAESDGQVRRLNGQLSDAGQFLASERTDLGAVLRELPPAVEQVNGFIARNRGAVKSNVDQLAGSTRALVDERGALAEILDVAPLGLANLARTYDPASGTLRTRADVNELSRSPIGLLCGALRQDPQQGLPPELTDVCGRLASVPGGPAASRPPPKNPSPPQNPSSQNPSPQNPSPHRTQLPPQQDGPPLPLVPSSGGR